jgi:hypothetical protein
MYGGQKILLNIGRLLRKYMHWFYLTVEMCCLDEESVRKYYMGDVIMLHMVCLTKP